MLVRLCTLALALTFLVGCGGGDGPKTVDVSGVVKMDGQPLADAEVNFLSEKHAGYGKTDASGKFTLTNGAAPGMNKITISKIVDPKLNPEGGLDAEMLRMEGQMQGLPTAKGEKVPYQYSVAAQSTLTFNVPAGGTSEANFDLKSK